MGLPIVGGAIEAGEKLVGNILPQTKNQAEDQALQAAKTQTDVNLAEAEHESVFVAGWRPYIGWICGTVVACYYIPYALASVVMWTILCWQTKHLQPKPDIGVNDLIGLLAPMLGFGVLRSLDKFNGVDTKNIKPLSK